MAEAYQKTPLNSVNRYRPRGKYDYETIHALIDAVPVLHVSFTAGPNEEGIAYPTILPMIGCMSGKDDENEPPVLYLHGYVSSRLIKQDGLPICVAATILDGLVLALTPNHHSCNYRSAVVFGKAYILDDEAERLYAMERITNNMLPDRWANSRVPPNKVEMQSTGILRVEIESGSAKVREGGPGEDRNDLKDEAMRQRVWTGVIPTTLQWGEPVALIAVLCTMIVNVVSKLEDYVAAIKSKTCTTVEDQEYPNRLIKLDY